MIPEAQPASPLPGCLLIRRRDCLDGMNAALAKGREDLLTATCIFVTLGTAWVFRHREVCVYYSSTFRKERSLSHHTTACNAVVTPTLRETETSGSTILQRKACRFGSKLENHAPNHTHDESISLPSRCNPDPRNHSRSFTPPPPPGLAYAYSLSNSQART